MHAVLFFDPTDFAESCPRRSSYAGFPAGEAALQERRLRGPPGLVKGIVKLVAVLEHHHAPVGGRRNSGPPLQIPWPCLR